MTTARGQHTFVSGNWQFHRHCAIVTATVRELVIAAVLFLGVSLASATAAEKAWFGFHIKPETTGFPLNPIVRSVVIDKVKPHSAAEALDIRIGDEIMEAEGKPVPGTRALQLIWLLQKQPGEWLHLRLKETEWRKLFRRRPRYQEAGLANDDSLGQTAAAVLELLSAAARAGLIAADLGHFATHRGEVQLHFAFAVLAVLTRSSGPLTLTKGRTGRRAILGRRCRPVLAHEELRQSGKEGLEGLQVRSAAEKVVQDFVLNIRHQLSEHVESFGLVFDERILLGVAAQVNAFAQRIHGIEMFLPETIDGIKNDVTLEALNCGRFFVARLPFVGGLDLLDQELRILFFAARFELRLFHSSGQAER